METQKVVNLLNGSDNETQNLQQQKRYVIDSETTGKYSQHNPIKFLTKPIESSLCDYSDAYILVKGNIAVTRTIAAASNNLLQIKQLLAAVTEIAFKDCAPFKDCRTEINDTFVDYTDVINTAMPMYNLIEYSDNYSDSSGSLWGFKRDDVLNNVDATNDDNAPLFKYKASLITNTEADETKREIKIAVPLKYLSNFLEIIRKLCVNYGCNWC